MTWKSNPNAAIIAKPPRNPIIMSYKEIPLSASLNFPAKSAIIPIPLPRGGREIDEFDFYDEK